MTSHLVSVATNLGHGFFVNESNLYNETKDIYNISDKETFISKYDYFIFDDMNGSTNFIERTFSVVFSFAHDPGFKKVIITSNASKDAF